MTKIKDTFERVNYDAKTGDTIKINGWLWTVESTSNNSIMASRRKGNREEIKGFSYTDLLKRGARFSERASEAINESVVEIGLGEGQMKSYRYSILNGETLAEWEHGTRWFLSRRDFRIYVSREIADFKLKSYILIWIDPEDDLFTHIESTIDLIKEPKGDYCEVP